MYKRQVLDILALLAIELPTITESDLVDKLGLTVEADPEPVQEKIVYPLGSRSSEYPEVASVGNVVQLIGGDYGNSKGEITAVNDGIVKVHLYLYDVKIEHDANYLIQA